VQFYDILLAEETPEILLGLSVNKHGKINLSGSFRVTVKSLNVWRNGSWDCAPICIVIVHAYLCYLRLLKNAQTCTQLSTPTATGLWEASVSLHISHRVQTNACTWIDFGVSTALRTLCSVHMHWSLHHRYCKAFLVTAGVPSNAMHARKYDVTNVYVADVVDGTAVLIIIHNPLRYSVVWFCNLMPRNKTNSNHLLRIK